MIDSNIGKLADVLDSDRLAAKDAEIAKLESRVSTLAAQIEEYRRAVAASLDLKRQLDVRSMENAVLRDAIANLRVQLAQLGEDAPALAASATAYPSAETTGVAAGTQLSDFSGTIADGQIIENKRFSRQLSFTAKNVTFRNCLFDFHDRHWLVLAKNASGTTWERCTFVGHGADNALHTGEDGQVLFCDISDVSNGITMGEGSCLAQGNFIHELTGDWTGAEPHNDGISVQGTLSDVVIRGNTILAWNTAGVFIKPEWGPIGNVLVEDNYIANQPWHPVFETLPQFAKGQKPEKLFMSYSLYSERGPGGIAQKVVVRNNRIEQGQWGYFKLADPARVKLSGNTTLRGNPL